MTDQDNTITDSNPSDVAPRSGLWKKIKFGIALCIGLAIVGFLSLPYLASRLLSNGTAEAWISGQMPGNVEIGDAAIGWHAPVMLNDVSYRDDSGQKLVQIRAITSNHSLWDIFRRPKHPVTLEFEGMQASLAVNSLKLPKLEGQKPDLNKVMQKVLQFTPPQLNRDIKVSIIDSGLKLTSKDGQILNQWHPITASFESKSGANAGQSLKIIAPVSSGSENPVAMSASEVSQMPGITVEADLAQTSAKSPQTQLTMTVNYREQPLEALQLAAAELLPDLPQLEPMTGSFSGQLSQTKNQQAALQLQTSTEKLPTGSEQSPPLSMEVDLAFSKPDDRIDVRKLFAQLDETSIDLNGEVTEVSGKQVVNATGAFKSPAEGLTDLLPEELKKNVEFKDIQMSEVSIKGPLRPDPNKPFNFVFEVSTNVSWSEATAYGIQSQNGKVTLMMSGNKLTLTPVNLPVSGGHIRKLPSLDLSTKPLTVSVEKGLTLDKLSLTEEICRNWLRYISPFLADATRPSGTFSLIANAGTFQLEKMNEADLSGKLMIHKGQVRPGPLADEILDMVAAVQLIKPRPANEPTDILFMKMEEHAVEYQIVDGRVYHAGFTFQVGDFNFSSNGSVGLDESLDIVLSMAFPDELAERGPILNALKDETLDFHITGTIGQPKVEAAQLKDVGKRIGIKAAEGLLQKILERRQNRTPRQRRDR